jgi:hypothetical protein
LQVSQEGDTLQPIGSDGPRGQSVQTVIRRCLWNVTELRVFDRIIRIYWIIESMPEAWTQKNQSRYARDCTFLGDLPERQEVHPVNPGNPV